MTGWTDLDGKQVMAGSPGIIGCFTVEVNKALGKYDRPSDYHISLSKLRTICETHGHDDMVEDCDLAERLITAAVRLFEWPEGKRTTREAARAALEKIEERQA